MAGMFPMLHVNCGAIVFCDGLIHFMFIYFDGDDRAISEVIVTETSVYS